MDNIVKIFASSTFSDEVMREHLPEKVYLSLKETSGMGKALDPEIAEVVAAVMKDWAVGKGATHYSHWFQPLNNVVAGKHDAFLSIARDGKVISEFSSAALVRGEPDASSFPSGGLRATFEARGYTAWDPSSPAFVRDGTLYIPTAFCAYNGEALDAKTPLLRAMQALGPQALRVLRSLGNTTSRTVIPTVGAEQEYFLIDREQYESRLDLKLCGRSLLGAKPPKGQELDDHYCGRIRLRVADFMRDLDERLWALGIPSKTKHNEVAPAQHELAPIFENANVACDNNLLTMEMMRVVAKQHGLACLLHEKPFAGVNGSGKHNNFSLSTDDGVNFLSPGSKPEENALFLVSLCAFIECVDDYADLLRTAAATPGNDHRLGANEAPPAIISIFLGENLSGLLQSIAGGIRPSLRSGTALNTDVAVLPDLEQDDSDRNRTSPFAFTGNKSEFRMLGSSQSIAFANVVLCTALADVFSRFADRLEGAEVVEEEVAHIIADTVQHHGRILFNGDNYGAAWVDEATARGLPVLNQSLDAFDCLLDEKNIALFARHGVLRETECRARYEISVENFIKVLTVEAETMLQMARRQIYPAVIGYLGAVCDSLGKAEAIGLENPELRAHARELSALSRQLATRSDALREAVDAAAGIAEARARAQHIQDVVRPGMDALRETCDLLESLVDESRWPISTYTDLLYRV